MKITILLAGGVALAAARPAAAQTPACCAITAIEARTGVVSAKVSATNQVFQFRVTDARTLGLLRVGSAVYANFSTKQVSLDGRSPCCAITAGPSAAPVTRAPAPIAPPPPAPAAAGVAGAAIPVNLVNTLPVLSYGPPQPRTALRDRVTSRLETKAVSSVVAGRNVSASVMHLRGLKAVEQAELPDGAKRLLEMLVRRTPKDQSDNYIVNVQQARDWIAAHPVPAGVKPTEPHEKKCGNWYDSWDCATEAVSDEWQRTFDHAVNEWNDATKTLSEVWQTTAACFTERTLSLSQIPVQFAITPSFSVNLSQSGARGSATGTVSGSAGLGIPMQANFTAQLEVFYIPCLPFAIRPKALSGDGVITVSEELTASVTASGSFDKSFTIPPTGGPVIPIQVIPIVIGGVPVSELDVSAYIEGNIRVRAEGKADAQFKLTNSNPTRFNFFCNGHGCSADRRAASAPPVTTSESAQIQGKVTVEPAVYTALQLDFNYEALSARVGPQPYLRGTASGCASGTATQPGGGAASTAENHALTADLDWGIKLRAEALSFRKVLGDPSITSLLDPQHLWFRDIAPGGSNALVALVESPAQAAVGAPVSHKIRMPSCYPYTERVQYQVSWSGNATPAPNPRCSWLAGGGVCKAEPAQDLVITLTWTAAGAQTLTVAPVGDAHDRTFAPAPKPTVVSVVVQ